MGPDVILVWISGHWQVALWMAGGLFGATASALVLLTKAQRDHVALWMMGAHDDDSWSRSFLALFDALFGRRHPSWRGFALSTAISIGTVTLLWLILGTTGALNARLQAALALPQVVVIALVVNALADYASLLETRLLLGQMHRVGSWLAQAAILVLDAALTALIVWGVLWAMQASGAIDGAFAALQALGWVTFSDGPIRAGLAEVVGLFSPLALFFYSTFVTSVWVWGYILSTWLMRAFASLPLHANYAEHPTKFFALGLSAALLATGFLGSAIFGALTAPDAQNLSPADRALCTFFKGAVCLQVRGLTDDEQTSLALTLSACEGGVTEECLRRGNATWQANGALAAQFYRVSCDAGNAESCTSLGYLHRHGIGITPDPAAAARRYRQGCDGGNALGCSNLGFLHEAGIGMDPDPSAAARLYRRGCDGGNGLGCTNLGFLHEAGIGMDLDPAAAARLFRKGCDSGNALGCTKSRVSP